MTLPASLPLSASQINAELGRGSTPAGFDIQGSSERALAGISAGAISFSDFLGKSLIQQTDSRTTPATSFLNVQFGPTYTGRVIYMWVFHGDIVLNPGLTPTAQIGDDATTTRLRAHSTGDSSSGNDATGVALFSATPSGTQGTVTVNWNGINVTIVVLSTPFYPESASSIDGHSLGSGSFTIDVPSNGLIIGAAGSGQNGAAITWGGLTSRGDENVGGANNRRTWAFDYNQPSQSGKVITVSPWSSLPGSNAAIVVAFARSL